MKLLYKAYVCERLDGVKYLLPGYPVEPEVKRLKTGAKIQVELADGTHLKTTCVNTGFLNLSESVMTHLNLRTKPGLYFAIQVPDDFSPKAVHLGVQVFLDDSQTNAALNGHGS